MARKESIRVVTNREALNAIDRGIARGQAKIGADFVERARGRIHSVTHRLEKSGGYLVLVNGRKVFGDAQKPKGTPSRGIVLVAGFGSPVGHLLEYGTEKMRPRPFATPTLDELAPRFAEYVKAGVDAETRGLP